MASARLVVWTGRGLQCLKCDEQIEAREGDMELAVNLHLEAHRNLEFTTRPEIEKMPTDTSPGKIQPGSSYNCPICKENVEIKYNDVKLSLKIHSKKHQVVSDKPSEDQLSSCSNKSKQSSKKNMTGDPQLPVDRLSNCSSGKNKLSSKKTNKEDSTLQTEKSESAVLDDTFNSMPLGLKAHRGFMLKNANGQTDCTVCNFTIQNTFSISDHLKTKSHEDNTIVFLKKFLSKDLLYEMDYVSFYGSNLCCNLCKCKIDLSSKNPFETIVSIMNHNAQKTHVKSNSGSVCQFYDINTLLQSYPQLNKLINDNKDYVNIKMQPQIMCNLCDKKVAYDEEKTNFLKNLKAHFTGAGHVKYKHAASVLKVFNKSNVLGREMHKLTPVKGSINCTVCGCHVEADLMKLEEHVKTSSTQAEGNAKLSFTKQIDHALAMDRVSLQNSPNVQENTNSKMLSIQSLLRTMPAQFRDVDYIKENDKGEVSCLVCNCTIPPTHYNLKTHLTGSKHKNNEEARLTKQNFLEIAVPSGGDGAQVPQIIDKYFNALMKKDPILANHESIIVKFGEQYLCNLCAVSIPSSQKLDVFRVSLCNHVQSEMHRYRIHSQSALTSMQGSSHTDSVKKHNSGLIFSPSALSIGSNDLSLDSIVLDLIATENIIKTNASYIEKKMHGYFCSLCQATIKQSYEPQVLKENFLSHFTGQKHYKGLDKVICDRVDKLAVSNPVIQAEKSFMEVHDRTIYCTLCTVTMTLGADESSFTNNIVSHFAGKKHQAKKKPELEIKPVPQPAKISQPIKPKHPSMSSNPFMSGPQSIGNHQSTRSPPMPANPFMFHPPPVPMPQPSMYTNPGMNLNNGNGFNLVADSFMKVPPFLQSEIKYIKTGSIEGYLTCTLCSSTINPFNLKDHLLGNQHSQGKKAFEKKLSSWKQNM